MQTKQAVVDHIPIIWTEPDDGASRGLVIWLPGFSGSKESTLPQLERFAEAGFTALSFDPYQHGERKVEPIEALCSRVAGNIRRHFWPMLALTAEEFPRIIDWAEAELSVAGPVLAGGVSMGGDIAVAAAGADRRIAAVSACIATPDWLRPGSHEPPGQPDAYATRCYGRRNPLSNAGDYAHRPAIAFQCGALDTQVPPDGAERFVAMLSELYPGYAAKLAVTKLAEVGHAFEPEMLERSVAWFRMFS